MAGDLQELQIKVCMEKHANRLEDVAEELAVSKRALMRRLKEL